MDSYKPFHLRFRPKNFDEFVGQDTAVKKVQGMIFSKKIMRTILITGPYGNGKTSMARMICLYLNCEKRKGKEPPCLQCDSCLDMLEGIHSDVTEMNAAESRGIDTIRELQNVSVFAPRCRYRIYIMDECHALTAPAQQSFLKMLEEPSERAIFILVTTNPEKLSDTIRSRCYKIELKAISLEDCASQVSTVALIEGIPITQDQAMSIARSARGHLRDALSVLESVSNYLASSPSEDITTLIPKAVEEALSLTHDTLALLFMKQVLDNCLLGALQVTAKVNDRFDYFFTCCLEVVRQLLKYSTLPGLSDTFYREWAKILKKEVSGDPDLMATLAEVLMDYILKSKTYLIEGASLLDVCAFKCVSIVSKKYGGV